MQSLLNATMIERVEKTEDLLAHLNEEMAELRELSTQLSCQHWRDILASVSGAERVLVCGFQTIRGLAEDFANRQPPTANRQPPTANRLALVRSGVEFFDLYSDVRHQNPHIHISRSQVHVGRLSAV